MTLNNKKDIAMCAGSMIVFDGVRSVVDPAVQRFVPENLSLRKRILAKIGALTISLAITHIVTKQVDEALDDAIEYYELFKDIKNDYKKTKEDQNDRQETGEGEKESNNEG